MILRVSAGRKTTSKVPMRPPAKEYVAGCAHRPNACCSASA
jgi:hypothetical protein